MQVNLYYTPYRSFVGFIKVPFGCDVIAKNSRTITIRSSMINTHFQRTAPTALAYRTGLPEVGEFWFSTKVLGSASAGFWRLLVARTRLNRHQASGAPGQ